MLQVDILFMFIAAIAFLGFLLDALFDRLKITSVLPLMLIGLLIGPVLGMVGTGPSSTLSTLTPYITAVAVAFILFDVGLNINVFKLSKVIRKATAFTILAAVVTALVIGGISYFVFHWNMLEALIFGFALAGPSSIIVPTLVKHMGASTELKTSLIYEGVASDSIQLIVPLLLLAVLVNTGMGIEGIAYFASASIAGSIVLGLALSLVLLYLLKKFRDYSKNYSWMLTITMVIATYGIAQQIGFNGALTVFAFGMVFANVGGNGFKITKSQGSNLSGRSRKLFGDYLEKYFALPDVNSVSGFQREIVFFTSTFFFVYIGTLFDISNLTLLLLGVGAAIAVAIVLLRRAFVPILNDYMPEDKPGRSIMKRVVSFDVSRGLSSSIVATLPLAYGLVIPGFLDEIFIIILFTNVASTIGVFMAYRHSVASAPPAAQPEGQAASPAKPARPSGKP